MTMGHEQGARGTDQEPDLSEGELVCLNCETRLYGDWCHACGQKRIEDDQRRLRWLVGQFVGKITSLDGKLPRSLLALVFRPGKLDTAWLRGQRASWISPISLFLVINLLYFLAPPITDFHLPLVDQLEMPIYSGWANERIEARFPEFSDWAASAGTVELSEEFRTFEKAFNRRSEELSKTLLILHVPLMAVVLMLLYRRRRIFLVDHFVIALHYWTFLLTAAAVMPRIATSVPTMLHSIGWGGTPLAGEAIWKFATLAWVIGYLVVALRRAYDQGWWRSLAKAIPAFGACIVAHFLYRAALFAITLWVI